jgi:hypothetical protein
MPLLQKNKVSSNRKISTLKSIAASDLPWARTGISMNWIDAPWN